MDGIYGQVDYYSGQEDERKLREDLASFQYSNYLHEISKHHSIEVMDAEVEKFLKEIPQNGWILDIGGCWGWHWRNIAKKRPDVKVVILDFIRQNLSHAKNILHDDLENNFYLVHGNALSLDFSNETFDGVWSVQTTQHIPDYKNVLLEVFRVLKVNGTFADYSFNIARLPQFIYYLFRKKYHLDGYLNGFYYLRRSNENQKKLVCEIFGNKVECRYTEIFFQPELSFYQSGVEGSFIGKLDSRISRFGVVLNFIARQKSFHVKKPLH